MAVKTIFRQAKWGLHFAKCFFFFAQKWHRVQTVLHRMRRPRCSVAEQHANTQSFICKADGMVMWYPSTSVMVWVPGVLINGSKAKMESMNSICCIFLILAFLFPKITLHLLCRYSFILFQKIALLIQMSLFFHLCVSSPIFVIYWPVEEYVEASLGCSQFQYCLCIIHQITNFIVIAGRIARHLCVTTLQWLHLWFMVML